VWTAAEADPFSHANRVTNLTYKSTLTIAPLNRPDAAMKFFIPATEPANYGSDRKHGREPKC
jgi:hypothetical protein